jgi:hypothetical protein
MNSINPRRASVGDLFFRHRHPHLTVSEQFALRVLYPIKTAGSLAKKISGCWRT